MLKRIDSTFAIRSVVTAAPVFLYIMNCIFFANKYFDDEKKKQFRFDSASAVVLRADVDSRHAEKNLVDHQNADSQMLT
jgi:hypothetical protein